MCVCLISEVAAIHRLGLNSEAPLDWGGVDHNIMQKMTSSKLLDLTATNNYVFFKLT